MGKYANNHQRYYIMPEITPEQGEDLKNAAMSAIAIITLAQGICCFKHGAQAILMAAAGVIEFADKSETTTKDELEKFFELAKSKAKESLNLVNIPQDKDSPPDSFIKGVQ